MKPLNTTVCECSTQITGKHIKPPLMVPSDVGIHDVNFYGGNVKRVAYGQCSCGEKYVLFLKPINNGYDIIDMAKRGEENAVEEGEKQESNKPEHKKTGGRRQAAKTGRGNRAR